jgi:hypothetical protein
LMKSPALISDSPGFASRAGKRVWPIPSRPPRIFRSIPRHLIGQAAACESRNAQSAADAIRAPTNDQMANGRRGTRGSASTPNESAEMSPLTDGPKLPVPEDRRNARGDYGHRPPPNGIFEYPQ